MIAKIDIKNEEKVLNCSSTHLIKQNKYALVTRKRGATNQDRRIYRNLSSPCLGGWNYHRFWALGVKTGGQGALRRKNPAKKRKNQSGTGWGDRSVILIYPIGYKDM